MGNMFRIADADSGYKAVKYALTACCHVVEALMLPFLPVEPNHEERQQTDEEDCHCEADVEQRVALCALDICWKQTEKLLASNKLS